MFNHTIKIRDIILWIKHQALKRALLLELAPIPLNPQMAHATLTKAWLFAAPLSIEELKPNKYLFTLTKSIYLDHILQQAPWNIHGSFLVLK